MGMRKMYICFLMIFALCAYKAYAVYNIKEIVVIDEVIEYSVFDDLLSDTIGVNDGIYKFKNDNKNTVFICTTRNQFEITKHIFIYNKKSKRMTVKNIPYFTWGILSYDSRYNEIVDNISSKLEHDKTNHKMNSKLKSLFYKIKKYNQYCAYSVERFEEKINNKKEK